MSMVCSLVGLKILLELWISYIIADEEGPPRIIGPGPSKMSQQRNQISGFLLQHPPAFLCPWLRSPQWPRALFSSSWPQRRTSPSFGSAGKGSPCGHIWCAQPPEQLVDPPLALGCNIFNSLHHLKSFVYDVRII
jgi:hypothetical protein